MTDTSPDPWAPGPDVPDLDPATIAPTPPRTDLWSQLGAAVEVGTVPGALYGYEQNKVEYDLIDQRADPDFNVLDHLTPDELKDPGSLVGAVNLQELELRRKQRDRQRELERYAAQGPLPAMLAYMAAGVVDPTTWVAPEAALWKVAKGMSLGRRVGLTAATTGTYAGGQQAAIEGLSAEGDLNSVLLATAFGGALGAGAGAIIGRKAGGGDLAADLTALLKRAEDDVASVTGTTPAGPLSAASNPSAPQPGDLRLVGEGAIRRMNSMLSKIGVSPVNVNIALSPLEGVRIIGRQIADTGLVVEGSLRGMADEAPITVLNQRADTLIAELTKNVDLAYAAAKKEGFVGSKNDFYRHLGDADRLPSLPRLQAVDDFLTKYRTQVLTPLERLYKQVTGKDAPLHRVFDVATIRAGKRTPGGETFAEYMERVALENKVDPEDAKQIAREIEEAIRNKPNYRINVDANTKEGSVNDWLLKASPVELNTWLDNDFMGINSRWLKSIMSDMHIFDRFKSLDFDKAIGKQVKDMYSDAREKANKITDTKKRERTLQALADNESKDLSNLEIAWDVARFMHGSKADPGFEWARAGLKGLRTYSFVRSMGSVAFTQLPDLMVMLGKEGMGRAFGVLVKDMLTGFRGMKMSAKEARFGGVVLNRALGSRATALMDLSDRYVGSTGRLNKAFDWTGDRFAHLVGLHLLNDVWQMSTSLIAMDDILRLSQKVEAKGWGALTRSEKIRMARSRVDPDLAAAIGRQSAEFATDEGGNLIANHRAWSDPGVADAFEAALVSRINSAVVTPTALDMPAWSIKHSDFGNSLLQFRRYMLTAQHQVLYSSLQQRDLSVASAMVGAVMMGMFAQWVRNWTSESGRKRNEKMTAAEWISLGVDYSGYGGAGIELAKMGEVFGLPVGTYMKGKLPEGERDAAFAIRQVFGPSAGALLDFREVMNDIITDGKLSNQGAGMARSLIPTQNYVFLTWLWDELEKSMRTDK